ncbi:MAG TPA: CoA transferase [Candidatus Acidoferrales bacterium]|nr:CoA transferase [Candidatus Acidoferrales bacterium]
MSAETNRPPAALAGLRVLDLTGRMGGYCGKLLANLGAEVILIEPPGGDPMRREGPFKDDIAHPEKSLSFAAFHTNKRGIVLDLETSAGRETLARLVRFADVLIEDRPAGYLDRLSLGYAQLQAINPALVMTSITGFGLSGPYRDFKTPNIVAFAMGGLMNLCGHPGKAPLVGPSDIAYHLGSIHAAFGTLVALYNRRGSGRGDHVEVSLQDVLVADPFLKLVTRYSVTAEIQQRTGHSQATTVADTYKCKDGYVRLFINQPDHWRRFVEWLGSPPELRDPKLENVQNRHGLRPLLDRLIEERTITFEKRAFFEHFQAERLAAAPINSPREFLADEQTAHRGYLADVDHRYLGRHRFPGDPYKLSETPWRISRGAPLLAEHQRDISAFLAQPSEWLGELRQFAPAPASRLPFHAVRVVAFPTGVVGPSLASLLADQGAEVIAIESAQSLPRNVQRGQRFQIAADAINGRNKKRVTINMKTAAGREIAAKLIAIADVLAENFSARVMASWGLDYPRVREIRPDIVMASLQAFGNTGPRRDYISFGPILLAFSGMTHLWRDPAVERPGAASQTALPDYIAPSYAAFAILAALHYRARTGKGQYIDLSQAETPASILTQAYLEWLVNNREPEPRGNFSPNAAPHGCYRCSGNDRWCVISVQSDEEWLRFCQLAGHPEWSSDSRFSSLAARVMHRTELDALVEAWTINYTPHQITLMLQRDGIAAGAVHTAEDLYRDPHLRERGSTFEVHHPEAGWFTQVAPAVRLAQSPPPRYEWHDAGQDNEAVLGELLGMPVEKIKALVEQGVLR